jgi:membrane protease subunit (stomatin/prohibitin family)
MAKIFKCDRCGKINETSDKAFGYVSNLSESMDLCENCTNELWDYAGKGRQPRG